MLSPAVRRDIIDQMQRVREISDVDLQYVEGFFRTYREVNEARLRSEANPSPVQTSSPASRPGLFDRLFNWGLGN
jgi:hypothetical protein